MTTHETLVRDVLHRATDDLTAPVPSLTATATVRGRRLRRRRRILTATGGLCAAALVAVPLGLSLGGTGAPGSVATDPTPSVVTPTVEGSAETTPPLVDNDAWSRMPAPEMLDVLDEHLSGLGITTADELLTKGDLGSGVTAHDVRGWLQADLVVDSRTIGGVNVVLYVTGLAPDHWTCPGNFDVPVVCDEILGPRGDVIGRRTTATQGDVVVREVVLQRQNGGYVYVAASNSADTKWGSTSSVAGPTVPLTLDELQAIAEDDAWIGYEPPTSD